MALVQKLELRQGQQLVMTPQLQQAIRLLQLSNVELCSFVEAEVERNPLLESEDVAPEPAPETRAIHGKDDEHDDEANADGSGDWSDGADAPPLNGAERDAGRGGRSTPSQRRRRPIAGPRCGNAPAMLSAARRAISRTSSRPDGRWRTT